jgi:hypothetical protein
MAAPTSSALARGDEAGALEDAEDADDREATRFEDIGVEFRAARWDVSE